MWIKIRFLCSLLKVPAPADRAYRVGLACSKNTRPSSLKSRAIIHNFQLKKKIMNGQPLKVGILCTQTLEQLKYIVNFFKSFFLSSNTWDLRALNTDSRGQQHHDEESYPWPCPCHQGTREEVLAPLPCGSCPCAWI